MLAFSSEKGVELQSKFHIKFLLLVIFADFNLPFVSAQFVSILIVLKGSALTYPLPSCKLLAAVEMNR